MKRLLLSFACLFAMTGTTSKAEKHSKSEEKFFPMTVECFNTATREEKVFMLKELADLCDCNQPGDFMHYLKSEKDLRLLNNFDDLSSSDFRAVKEVASKKASSHNLCLKIAYHMLEREEEANKREFNKRFSAALEATREELLKLSKLENAANNQ